MWFLKRMSKYYLFQAIQIEYALPSYAVKGQGHTQHVS